MRFVWFGEKRRLTGRWRRIVSTCQAKKEAEAVYDDAISQNRTPVLLESEGDVFALHLGNVGAGERVRVTVALVHALERDEGGAALLRLPYLLLAPRSGWARVVCDVPEELAASCLSGGAVARREAGAGRAGVALETAEAGEVTLRFAREQRGSDTAAVAAVHADAAGELCALVSFVPRWPAHVPAPECEVLLLVDRSGSVDGRRMAATRCRRCCARCRPVRSSTWSALAPNTRRCLPSTRCRWARAPLPPRRRQWRRGRPTCAARRCWPRCRSGTSSSGT